MSTPMETFSSTNSNGSSENQQPGSFQNQQPGYFQNQPIRRLRKCGIAALLSDITNAPASPPQRSCREGAKSKVAASMAPTFDTNV